MNNRLADTFDALFDMSDDPWSFRTRWYEARKRAMTLAALPDPRYAHAFELGCANGELAADLATRCDRLLACDAAAGAVRLARQRLAGCAHVSVVQAELPDGWPAGVFDLIVVSEIGYYLTKPALQRTIEHCSEGLTPTGTLVACHWRAPIDGCALAGDAVQALIHSRCGLRRLVHHAEADFVLDVWSGDERSVAQREGFA